MKRLPPAFVLGDGVNALGVVRSLGRKGVPVHLFTTAKDDLAVHSRFLASVVRIDKQAQPDSTVALLLEKAREAGARPALFFTTDKNLLLASHHRDELAHAFWLQLPPSAAVHIVTDKAEFGRFTEAHAFPAPRTFSPASVAEVEEVARVARFPLVIKPTVSFHWVKKGFRMWKVDDASALLEAWRALESGSGGLLIQEYVDAPDDQHFAYYSYRTPERGEVTHITVQKLRVYPVHGGAGAFVQVVDEPELENIGRSILERLEYTGIASVCFKKSAASGEPLIYEINGRMPQCHGAFRIKRIDLPWLMYRDIIGEPIPAPVPTSRRGCWTSLSLDVSAFLNYRKRGELGAARWLASYARVRTCAEFACDDPAPFLEFVRRVGTHVAGSARNKPAAPESSTTSSEAPSL